MLNLYIEDIRCILHVFLISPKYKANQYQLMATKATSHSLPNNLIIQYAVFKII